MNVALARRDQVLGEAVSSDRAPMFEHEVESVHVEKLRSLSSHSGDMPAAESQVITLPLFAERGRTR
jgi:hypothetical protein